MSKVARRGRPRLPVLLPLVFGLLFLPAAGGLAQQASEDEDDPGALALEGAGKLMRALEALMLMIPQYEMPELTEDGDIIIRRKRPEAERDDAPLGDPEVDETST